MRLRNDPSAKKIIDNSKYVITEFPIKLDSDVVLEIGMGKGEMLTQLALNNPNKIFIGIEKYPTVAVKAIKKAQALNLNNFFVVNKDLIDLKDAFSGHVQEIWLTFSDPWPKKRHFKRRLTYKSFLDIYKSILGSKGILKIKTDNDAFFDWSIESIQNYGAKIVYITRDLHNDIKNADNIPTGYEIKWSQQNKNINFMEIQFD